MANADESEPPASFSSRVLYSIQVKPVLINAKAITIGSVSAKLKAVPGLNNQGRQCAVFQVEWNGVKAYAKQNVGEEKKVFDEEIAKTKLVRYLSGFFHMKFT